MIAADSAAGFAAAQAGWMRRGARFGHRLQTMCPYAGAFAPRLPQFFIEALTEPGEIVLDPFCGRGTTPLQACASGRPAIGADRSPLAWLLTSAKLSAPSSRALLRRIEDLEADMFYADADEQPAKARRLFHNHTLSQLAYLRGMLDREDACDRFLLAALCGMAAPDSPPRDRLCAAGAEPPRADVFAALRRRLDRLGAAKPLAAPGEAFQEDARRLADLPSAALRRKRVRLALGAPPVFRAPALGACDWLRFWLIGEDAGEWAERLAAPRELDEYLDWLLDVARQAYRILEPGGHLVFVLRDLPPRRGGKPENLAERFWRFARRRAGRYEFRAILDDSEAPNGPMRRALALAKPA